MRISSWSLSVLLWVLGLVGCGGSPVDEAGAVFPLVPTASVGRPTPTLSQGLNFTAPTPPVASATLAGHGQDGIGDPYMPELGNAGYDVTHYTLRFEIDPLLRIVNARATLTVLGVVEPLTRLSLDFLGFDITSLIVDGEQAAFVRERGKLRIDLPRPRLRGQAFTVDILYRGEPPAHASPFLGATTLGLRFNPDGTAFAFSEPDGARAWFPANDHPRDKALFRFEITVPAGLVGVANGQLVAEERLEARTRFVWEHAYPMATYLAVIAVGPFERLESVAENGVRLRHYILPEARENFDAYAGVNEEAIAWLAERLGPYPFEAYGYLTVDLPGVSMETQTMVILSTGMIGERTMVHEMAHMWFGDWVSLDSWSEMWRNEGFATYFQLLWEYRDDVDGLEAEMVGIAAAVEEDERDYPLGDPPPAELFGFETYFKGALLAHALRLEVGDAAFYEGLRAYLERYGGGTASDDEFVAMMATSAGRPLGDFFAAWLE